jgi:multidrug efflux pump subunit AcrA (membrane-fusion protein)
MDELRAEVRVGKGELQQAKLRKQLAELELTRAQAILEQRTIRSPLDGIVIERHLSGGEYVHQEARIVTIAQLDPLHVETFLPVVLYGRIGQGTVGIVRPDEPIGGERRADVIVVDRVFDAASGTFGVRLELPNPGQKLPAGQRCSVTFNIDATN